MQDAVVMSQKQTIIFCPAVRGRFLIAISQQGSSWVGDDRLQHPLLVITARWVGVVSQSDFALRFISSLCSLDGEQLGLVTAVELLFFFWCVYPIILCALE